MKFTPPIILLALSLAVSALNANAGKPVSLIGTVVKWQYPESKISGAEMADAATTDAKGDRTVPSSVLKATMTTEASVDDVLEFYQKLLKRDENDDLADIGKSVIFHDESEGRPFAFHTILVNSATTSTTVIITRGADEKETRITWKQYLRHRS